MTMIKAVILIGGPMKGRNVLLPERNLLCIMQLQSHVSCEWRHVDLQDALCYFLSYLHTGTRFRPLSLELPKPLFPIGGFPVIYHHIEACTKVYL